MAADVFTFDEKRHEFRLNGRKLDSITQILKARGFINEEYYNEEGRVRGTAVHRACWYYDEGDLYWPELDDRIKGYVLGWEKFRQETGFEPEVIELPLYHPLLNFAGIPDRAGQLGGRRAIVEIKSGGVGAWAALQTGAQELLLRQGRTFGQRTDSFKDYTGPVDRYAVQLFDDGAYKIHPFNEYGDKNIFTAELSSLNWRKNHAYAE
ncbi:MAG: hypothetical protein HY548_00130 [Elusimicrobia bacterium]|nr:hypothetical protein [Elusimicrobiota bacterium]